MCLFLGLADVFLLGRELEAGYLSSVVQLSLFPLASSWHTRMPKAITVQYQLHLLDGSRNVAAAAAELQ